MNLQLLEKALKQMRAYEYVWGRKQNNTEDKATDFIYEIRSFSELLKTVSKVPQEQQNYAMIRWYNFWSAKGVEYIFCKHPLVQGNKNIYDKLVDFSIDGTTFDHKTTVFPNGFRKDIQYAKENKLELIKWLYENQSQQGRKHLKNRLFICLYDGVNQEHWKLKAEIGLLKISIDAYMENYNVEKLTAVQLGSQTAYSDIIWIRR